MLETRDTVVVRGSPCAYGGCPLRLRRAIPDSHRSYEAHNSFVNPVLRAGLAAAALAWGLLFTTTSHTPYGLYWFSLVGVAWAFVAAGLAAWSRRPETSMGRLMTVTGFLWLIPSLVASRTPLLWTIGSTLSNVGGPMLFYLILAYPRGVLAGRLERIVVVLSAIGLVLLGNLLGALWFDPRTSGGCTDCPPGINLLQVGDVPPRWVDLTYRYGAVPIVLLAFALLSAIIIRRWMRATRPARRILWPVYAPALLFGLDSIRGVAVFNYMQDSVVDFGASWDVWLAVVELLLLPVSFLFGLLRMRARRARIGDLVVELGEVPPTAALEQALSRALGDPSVRVGFWVPEQRGYVTADGHPLPLETEGAERATTVLESEGRPLAAIVHDASLLEDPKLVDSVAAAARLAVERERLAAQVKAQLEEVRKSRQRIVEAADEERRNVERDLHDGAQQRLVKLSTTIRLTQARVGKQGDPAVVALLKEATDEVHAAHAELRALAQGIHPAILTQEGLHAAIEALAELSPVPVRIDAPSERYPAAVESTAYFVVSECLANIARHAHAAHAEVKVVRENGTLIVEVSDDGIGGASPDGSGLRGLADRVAALDGRLRVESPQSGGTRVMAEMRCA